MGVGQFFWPVLSSLPLSVPVALYFERDHRDVLRMRKIRLSNRCSWNPQSHADCEKETLTRNLGLCRWKEGRQGQARGVEVWLLLSLVVNAFVSPQMHSEREFILVIYSNGHSSNGMQCIVQVNSHAVESLCESCRVVSSQRVQHSLMIIKFSCTSLRAVVRYILVGRRV